MYATCTQECHTVDSALDICQTWETEALDTHGERVSTLQLSISVSYLPFSQLPNLMEWIHVVLWILSVEITAYT